MDDSQTVVDDVADPVVVDDASQAKAGGEQVTGGAQQPKDGDVVAPDAEGTEKPDWRTEAAGDNKDLLRLAKRYGSQTGMLKALADAKAQLSKGQIASATLPDDATDDQKAEWRKSRDIPDAPEAYDVSIKGIDWTDDDKAVIGEFTKTAFGQNLSKVQTKEILQWYANSQIAANQERDVAAVAFHKDTVKALKAEYGADYDRNISLMKDFGVSQLGGEDVWDKFIDQRLQDGTKIGDNPAFMRLIMDSALDRGDGLPFVGGSGASGMSDADIITSHKELVRTAQGSGKDAKEAQRKMKDPEYDKRIKGAYERQAKRSENKRGAA